jgi:hypothetical protein
LTGGGVIGPIEGSALAQAMRGWLWLYPSVEIVHIAGLAILFGSIVMFDLRLLGLSKTLSVRGLLRHLLPWTLASLLLVVPSGLSMFSAHASDFIGNPAFLTKMTLIMLAGCNALAFHVGVYTSVGSWDRNVATPVPARLHGIVSILLWLGVISCGRLLAYL